MRGSLLLAAIALSSCVRKPASHPASLEEDESIAFPNLSGADTIIMDEPGRAYELDGVTLQALTIASQDFIPSAARDQPCWNRPETYRYRVVRQEDIIFVGISVDPAACERKFLMLDSGVRYAISTDGRILRRLFTGEPDGTSVPASLDAGRSEGSGELDLSPILGPPSGDLPAFLRSRGRDDGGSSQDGGTPAAPPN
jgi:hypothetical protein